jgi:hypothetical protein
VQVICADIWHWDSHMRVGHSHSDDMTVHCASSRGRAEVAAHLLRPVLEHVLQQQQ